MKTEQNGLALFKSSLRQIVCPQQIREALHNSDSDSSNIRKYQSEEITILPEDIDPPAGVPKSFTLDRPYTLDEKTAILIVNKAAIDNIEKSLEVEWPKDMPVDDGERIVIYTTLRLLALKGNVSVVSGKYPEAAESYINGIDVVSRTSHRGSLLFA